MLKYPWEQEIEEVEAREQAVEKGWKTAAESRAEEIGKYGLEYWIYFQSIRALVGIFLLISLLAAPKITFVLQGSAIQQTDIFAWTARVSLGNVDLGTKLHLGLVDLTLADSPILGVLDVLQLALPLAFVVWFRFFRIPWLVQNPELRTLSAAEYAVQVDGLPPRLPDETANQKYDFELLRHFEVVLRGLKGADATSMVCETALARDFSGALLVAQQRSAALDKLQALQEAAEPSQRRLQRLQEQIAALSRELVGRRAEETERPVWRAYVVLGSIEERRRLLHAYRWASMPICGRLLQPKRLCLDGRWPLRLSAAPEPSDIIWAHCRSPLVPRLLRYAATLPVLVFALAACGGLSHVIWSSLLGTRGAAATQCSPTGGLVDATAACLAPQGSSLNPDAAAPGCDCICLSPPQWHTSADECRSLGAWQATGAVVACWALAEVAHVLLAFALPPVVDRWRTALASDIERGKLATMAVGRALVPLSVSFALIASKASLLTHRPNGLAEPLIWEVDRGWYLHAAPVAALWCLFRWIGPVAFAFATCCCGAGRGGYRILLWERWASLASVVAVSLVLQPLVPYLAPLAMLGLIVRYWAEKRVFLRGHVVTRSGTPSSIAVNLVRVAFAVIWLSTAVAALLAAWAQGQGSDFGRCMKGPALPNFCFACAVLLIPVVARLVPRPCRCMRRKTTAAEASLSFQEAWLMMRHVNALASYQIHEHPAYKGGAVFKELQPDIVGTERVRAPVLSHWSRNLDAGSDNLPSLAIVGDKPPTRSGK